METEQIIAIKFGYQQYLITYISKSYILLVENTKVENISEIDKQCADKTRLNAFRLSSDTE